MIAFILALVFSIAILVGAFTYIQKSLAASGGSEKKEISQKIHALDQEIKELLKYSSSYASKGQFDTLVDMVNNVRAELEGEKGSLKSIEQKLDQAQKDVETKEYQQQEMKSAKEEDEKKLTDLLGSYEQVSSESVNLEQKLAQSLKNLDSIMAELTLSDNQRSVLEDLSNALTTAGSLLRELITENNSVNERITMLKEQHDDLEDEYTRLVEQQLGE